MARGAASCRCNNACCAWQKKRKRNRHAGALDEEKAKGLRLCSASGNAAGQQRVRAVSRAVARVCDARRAAAGRPTTMLRGRGSWNGAALLLPPCLALRCLRGAATELLPPHIIGDKSD